VIERAVVADVAAVTENDVAAAIQA
jgi:hypothetical protein